MHKNYEREKSNRLQRDGAQRNNIEILLVFFSVQLTCEWKNIVIARINSDVY